MYSLEPATINRLVKFEVCGYGTQIAKREKATQYLQKLVV